MLNVYVIVEQGEKTYWKPCGVAFENRDGSFNIKLDLFPGVTLNMKERKDSTDSDPEELEGNHERNGNSHRPQGRGQDGQRSSNGSARSRRD